MKKMKNIKGDGPNAIRGALKGALKGALTGGAAGSVGGAGGAFIGGVSGAVIGGVSGSRKENNIQRSINVANAASAMAEHEAKVANSTPAPVVEDAPVVDPVQDELSRQRDEVMAGNVNSAQADYFREQNEGLFMRERKGTNPSLAYNKSEKITGANPVSNREDKMTKLFGGLYGSEESRGIL
jgi:uncharacterized protein YcfJ